MIDSIIEALQYPFFIRSLVIVILLGLIFPLYGNIVVIRKEANIAHAFAHMWLLWIAIGLLFDIPIEICILWSIIFSIILLRVLAYQDKHSFDAINEILANLGLVSAILIVSQMSGYRADLNSYLFGDILLVTNSDVFVILGVTLFAIISYFVFNKRWYASSLNMEIALSKKFPLKISSFLYLVTLGIIIGAWMKIIGVLLVSAFLILPSNIAKIISNTKKQWIGWWIAISILMWIFAMFLAWHLNLPAWASIVWVLIWLYIIIQLYNLIKEHLK